jgi:hypothetical protein
MGIAMSRRWLHGVVRMVRIALVVAAYASLTGTAQAQERHAVLVIGAPGGDTFAQAYSKWQSSFLDVLRDRLGFDPSRIVVLSGATEDPSQQSTRENVRRAFERLRQSTRRDDLVVVVLVGHGTADDETAKFNLPGPDLEAGEWASLVEHLPGRLVFINSTGASFPFLERLSARNRIVITATDTSAQRFDTVFADELLAVLSDPATDLDRNGRVSLWEVFSQTSAAVRQYYEQRGQLSTERPLLDDNGDRRGLEAGAPGPDGSLARTTYLDRDPAASTDDPALAALLIRQQVLEEEAEALKLQKSSMPPEEWNAAFEKLMIELARVSRTIRQRS